MVFNQLHQPRLGFPKGLDDGVNRRKLRLPMIAHSSLARIAAKAGTDR